MEGAYENDHLPARCARRRGEGRADRYEHQRRLPGRAARRTGTGEGNGEDRHWRLPAGEAVRRQAGTRHRVPGPQDRQQPEADAWLTPKGTIAVYDHREQELWIYDEYGAFEDDEGLDNSLREQVAEALGAKYVEELDI